MEKISSIIEDRVKEIFELYKLHGDEHYGEGVTQLMHMVQAANLARQERADDEMVLAAFYHDIGHFFDHGDDNGAYGNRDHDQIGCEYLRNAGFSDRIALLVASHVPTKRYLTFAHKGYYENLSDASKETLKLQGGPMTADEASIYAADPMIESFIKIRLWDDQAKDIHFVVDAGDLAYIRTLTIHHLDIMEKSRANS